MNICFLETTTKDLKVTDAHVRNCLALKKELELRKHKVDIEFNNTIEKNNKKNYYDVIIVSYGTFYCKYLEMKRVIQSNPKARLFWMTNEYDLTPDCSYYSGRESEVEIIANYEKKENKYKKFRDFHFLNLNTLIFKKKTPQEKKYDICYYGTYRKNRVKYFKKYFNKNFYLSTTAKNFKKFKSVGCDFKPLGKMRWTENSDTLGLFKYSLYIEDEHTHNHYNCLANRFYEAVANETVILFDKSCLNTLEKSELREEDYRHFIIDKLELDKRSYEKDIAIQKKWVKLIEEERRKCVDEFERIIKKANLKD